MTPTRHIIFFLLLFGFGFSCKKPGPGLEVCSQNCKTYQLQGRLFNGVTKEGMAGEPFTLRLESFRGSCIFCPRKLKDIYRGVSDESGRFSFDFTIDSSLLRDYAFRLIPAEKKDYFIIPVSVDYASLNDNEPLMIAYYKKVELEIRLKRTMADSYQSMEVFYTWVPTDGFNREVMSSAFRSSLPVGPADTTFVIQTAADVMTYVYISKYTGQPNTSILDSIVCKTGVKNKIELHY